MKYIFLLLLSYSILISEEIKQKVTIGFGSYMQTQAYKDVDNIILPSPVIFFDNSIFYLRWTRIGLYFLGEKNKDFSWGLSFTTQPRVYGYNTSDIEGMNERKNSWESGLAFSIKTGKTYMEIIALTDVLDRYKSWVVKTKIGYDLEYDNFSFYPSFILAYQSDDFMNYYYGVTSSEAINREESEYIANAGLQLGIQTYIQYPLTQKISLLINIRADKLSSATTSSTIIEDHYIYSGLASLIYTFEY